MIGYCSVLGEEIEGIGGFVKALVKMGVKPVFFSDISRLHLSCFRGSVSFSHLVSDGIYSFEVGHLKPHVSMYEAMEQGFCAGGCPVLYVDDKPENIAMAESRGWNAFLFEDCLNLTNILKKIEIREL